MGRRCEKKRTSPCRSWKLCALSASWLSLWLQHADPSVLAEEPQGPKKVEPTEAPKGRVFVEGQLTDAIGAGVAEAAVRAFFKIADGSRGELIAETKTDAMGDFALRTENQVTGEIIVTLTKDRFAESSHVLTVGEGESPVFLAETMHGNLVLSGRVEDIRAHSSVAEANLTLESHTQRWESVTDAEGKFRIRGVSPGPAELIVESNGFGRERIRIKDVEAAGELVVVLKPQRIVRFRVLDDQGQPIGGATLECMDPARNDFQMVLTDADGGTVVEGVHFDARGLRVRISHEDFISTPGFNIEVDLPSDNAESTHELSMIRAAKVEGRVIRADDGQPLHAVRVMAGDEMNEGVPPAWTDPDGQFTLVGLPAGRIPLTAHRTDYAPELVLVDIELGGATRVEIKMQSARTVSGYVKGQIGEYPDEQISGAEVIATKWRGFATLGLRAMTNEAGAFWIGDAPIDEFELVALAPGFEAQTKTAVPGASAPLVFELKPRAAGSAGESSLKIGDPPPDVTLTTLSGERLRLRELTGKTVLIDFWATWCAPCVEDMPALAALHEKYAGRKDFLLIGVSRDFNADTLKDFLKKNPKITWPQAGGDGGEKPAVEAFQVQWIPSLFLIGSNGELAGVYMHLGAAEDAVEKQLNPKKSE